MSDCPPGCRVNFNKLKTILVLISISLIFLFSLRPVQSFEKSIVWWNGTSDHTLFLGHCMRQDVALIACLFFFFLVGRVAGKEGRMRYLLLQMEMRQT